MSGEKTEKPSAKKLKDAREKGDVAYSKDFTQTLLVVSLTVYLIARGKDIANALTVMMLLPASLTPLMSMASLSSQSFRSALATMVHEGLMTALNIVGPMLLLVIVVGLFSDLVQVGVVLAFEKLKPKGEKLNPVTNLKNIFSKKNAVEFLKSSLKIALLVTVVWHVVANDIPALLTLPRAGLEGIFVVLGGMMQQLIIAVALVYLVIGIADLLWQRHQFRSGLKMSKQEVKQEYKEMEGDPHVRGMRKRLQREMATQGQAKKARNATALVTNPTHVAIALHYDQDDPGTPLPIVIAKGEGAIAEAMMREARDAGVPIVQNIPLARALLAQAPLDEFIPEHFIEPVAEVLRFVRDVLRTDEGIAYGVAHEPTYGAASPAVIHAQGRPGAASPSSSSSLDRGS